MTLPQISPYTPVPEPVQVKKAEPQSNQGVTSGTVDAKSTQKVQTDTVTISQQAAKMTQQLYSTQEEAKETTAHQAVESAQGKQQEISLLI